MILFKGMKLRLEDNELLVVMTRHNPQNFIADYTSQRVMMDESGNFSDDAFKTKLRPALIHIYHNFGMKGWDIWDYVEELGNQLSVEV